MKTFLKMAALAALAAACAPTQVNLSARPMYAGRSALPPPDCEAQVADFRSALELPDGSKHLGSVTIRSLEGEAAYRALREKVCALGGDSVTQAVWVQDPGDESPRLVANAWERP